VRLTTTETLLGLLAPILANSATLIRASSLSRDLERVFTLDAA